MSIGKIILYVILGIVAVVVGMQLLGWVVGILAALIKFALMAGLVALVVYAIYRVARPKALGGNGKPLP